MTMQPSDYLTATELAELRRRALATTYGQPQCIVDGINLLCMLDEIEAARREKVRREQQGGAA